MVSKSPRKSAILENGKRAYGPKRGEKAGPWVETDRVPLDMVRFGWFRGEPVYATMYDEITRVRLLSNGRLEIDVTVKPASKNIDVRDANNRPNVQTLVHIGAHAARALGRAYRADRHVHKILDKTAGKHK